jgi:outer membrane protein, multidrug efflux system
MRYAYGKTLALAVSAILSTCLAGCALAPPPESGDYRSEALPGLQVPGRWTGGDTTVGVAAGWLASFEDSQLQALVAEAVARNPDLRVAAAQVAVASEYARLADATLWPQVNLLARGGGDMGGDSSGLQGVGVFADWEIDLWGRLRSAKAAQYQVYVSTAADAEFARQSIAALTAKSYFLAIEAGAQQRLAEEMVTAANQLVSLAEQRERVVATDSIPPWHEPTSKRFETRSSSSSSRDSRRCAHSKPYWGAIRPPPSIRRHNCPISVAWSRLACPRRCSNVGPT